jgi:LPXTG-site transpeptidase (sortase) family protein
VFQPRILAVATIVACFLVITAGSDRARSVAAREVLPPTIPVNASTLRPAQMQTTVQVEPPQLTSASGSNVADNAISSRPAPPTLTTVTPSPTTPVQSTTSFLTPAVQARTIVRDSATPAADASTDDWRQVTKLEIPRIHLLVRVVLAPLVQIGKDRTWSVPSFRVGHAQYTAGAGDVGNTVLIGHVSSVDAGSVFRNLHLLRPGDVIRVWSGATMYQYSVTVTAIVARRDVSVVRWTPNPTLTLITCAGAWVPAFDDYASRLVVRAAEG